MTKDVGIQPITLFLNCWTMMTIHFIILINYSKNIILLESKIQEYSIQIQELKKEICSLNTTVQELKSKKLSLEKIKDDPNAVRFYNGAEKYDALIAVFTCLEPKASRIHFLAWHRQMQRWNIKIQK